MLHNNVVVFAIAQKESFPFLHSFCLQKNRNNKIEFHVRAHNSKFPSYYVDDICCYERYGEKSIFQCRIKIIILFMLRCLIADVEKPIEINAGDGKG
jgi:hypothetical protein